MIYFYINCMFFHGFQWDMFAVSCSHVVHAVLSVARFDPHFGAWCPSKKANVYRDCCDPLISNSKK